MTFKLPLVLLMGLAAFTSGKAQMVVGTTTPIDPSAIVQMVSNNKGFLPPLLSNTQRNAISNPATGLIVFNTTTLALEINVGTAGSPSWTSGPETIYSSNGTVQSNRTIWQQGYYLNFTGTGGIIFNSGPVNFSSNAVFNGTDTHASQSTFNGSTYFNNLTTFNAYSQFNAVLSGSGANISGIGIGIRGDGGINIGQNNSNNVVSIGYTAGQYNYGYNNQFVGYQAGASNSSGYNNTFEGNSCGLYNTSGYQNTFMGSYAGNATTSGHSNVYIGDNAGYRSTTGFANVVIGSIAAGRMMDGFGNVFVGQYAASNNIHGYLNTSLGYSAGPGWDGQFNSTAIGYEASTNSNNQIQLGDGDIQSLRCQVPLSVTSDARFKYQVNTNVPGLAFIQKLRPVTYRFDNKKLKKFQKDGIISTGFNEDETAPIQTGFLAQEVEKAVKELGVTFDAVHVPTNDKDYYTLSYAQFVMPLVKGMQEQQDMIGKLTADLAILKARLAKLEQK